MSKTIIHKSTSDRIVLDSYYISNKDRKIKSYALIIPKRLYAIWPSYNSKNNYTFHESVLYMYTSYNCA